MLFFWWQITEKKIKNSNKTSRKMISEINAKKKYLRDNFWELSDEWWNRI